jgi:hypothetical protein
VQQYFMSFVHPTELGFRLDNGSIMNSRAVPGVPRGLAWWIVVLTIVFHVMKPRDIKHMFNMKGGPRAQRAAELAILPVLSINVCLMAERSVLALLHAPFASAAHFPSINMDVTGDGRVNTSTDYFLGRLCFGKYDPCLVNIEVVENPIPNICTVSFMYVSSNHETPHLKVRGLNQTQKLEMLAACPVYVSLMSIPANAYYGQLSDTPCAARVRELNSIHFFTTRNHKKILCIPETVRHSLRTFLYDACYICGVMDPFVVESLLPKQRRFIFRLTVA